VAANCSVPCSMPCGASPIERKHTLSTRHFLIGLFHHQLTNKPSQKNNKRTKVVHFLKYKNLSKTCKYPFENCGVGYCWGFAKYVDGVESGEEIRNVSDWMRSHCKKCEFYNV